MPHSVPSKRGTRSRVQLVLSPGCTWHERTLHISWCDKRNKEVKEETHQHRSPKSCSVYVPDVWLPHWYPKMQAGSLISFAIREKLWVHQMTSNTSCNARRGSTKAVKISRRLEISASSLTKRVQMAAISHAAFLSHVDLHNCREAEEIQQTRATQDRTQSWDP